NDDVALLCQLNNFVIRSIWIRVDIDGLYTIYVVIMGKVVKAFNKNDRNVCFFSNGNDDILNRTCVCIHKYFHDYNLPSYHSLPSSKRIGNHLSTVQS